MFAAEKIGNIMSRLILTLIYFTIFAIPGISSRLFSDKLQIKKKKSTYWSDVKDKVPKDLEEGRRQG